MDKIILNNLAFYGYHGALAAEKEIGQKFFIDIVLYTDISKAGDSDRLEDAINYASVYDLVKKICTKERYNLLEALATQIANGILFEFPRVKEVLVKIKKPEAPVDGIFDYFGVEIRRGRDE
ncbi:dihydroneopterin aldolase [Halonatronum saccharophilum]|uniref:dihydroneopterin aldolase n=1 Tax=Halonatronum saccharophilum TaxID=150060 RepID=UPI00048996A2|nr:dihydroneopterin aldolase [Halonatronum saccharophilum]